MSQQYKQNNDANRDALFAPPSSTKAGPKHKRENEANRDALFGGISNKNKGSSSKPSSSTKSSSSKPSSSNRKPPNTKSSSTSSNPAAAAPPTSSTITDRGYSRDTTPKLTTTLSGAAKMSKLKQAEQFRDQATQALQRGVFTRPDPVAAANYYQRAAEAYHQCGEARLERLHRVASADCQLGTGSYAAAAHQYTQAAKLAQESNEETMERKRKEGSKFYTDAANAWTKAGEPGKAANCHVLAALAWTWEDETTLLDKQALIALEEAVEAHVPDVLNVYARYRQTGISKFVDPRQKDKLPSPETMTLANEHMVKTPYAHEPIQDVLYTLVRYGEYPSALYACGAVSAMLEQDGVATLTLSRNYVNETILALSIGDPVLAEEQFLQRHVQKTHYLTSRECKLAEDLYRAVLHRNVEALEEARSPQGDNRTAMANLHANLRGLVQNLRISGVAQRTVQPVATKTLPPTPKDDDSSEEEKPPPNEEEDDDDQDDLDPTKLSNELENVMAGLDELEGLGDDDDDLDDDDIDLR